MSPYSFIEICDKGNKKEKYYKEHIHALSLCRSKKINF